MMEIRRGRYRGSDDCFYYIFGQGFYRETSQRFVILFREDRGLEDREYDLIPTETFLCAGYTYIGGRSI